MSCDGTYKDQGLAALGYICQSKNVSLFITLFSHGVDEYPVLPVEDFVDKVKSMGDEFDDDRSVIEAKKRVIAPPNKFQEPISLSNHSL